jgi:hypothetical protein
MSGLGVCEKYACEDEINAIAVVKPLLTLLHSLCDITVSRNGTLMTSHKHNSDNLNSLVIGFFG